MNVAIIVATYGDSKWAELAVHRAYPTALLEAGDSHQVSLNHLNDGTLAQSRNQGASFATADWLCFLDADDELEPGYLDAMSKRFAALPYGEALLVPLLRRIPPDHERTVQRIATGSGVSRESVGDVTPIASIPNQGRWPQVNECVIGTLVRRDLFEAVGGFRDTTDDGTAISMYEDWDLWLRCYDAGARLVYTDAIYREHVSPAGRNTDAHSAQTMYDAIWRDHETRTLA